MRIILSRKGADSSANSGGFANIIENGKMYMIPIPFQGDKYFYKDLKVDNKSLFEIMKSKIKNLDKKNISENTECHPDPSIYNYFNDKNF
jgi:hypothetical protein